MLLLSAAVSPSVNSAISATDSAVSTTVLRLCGALDANMRKVGLAAFDNNRREAFSDLSTNFLQEQAEQLNTQLSVFQSALTYFAVEHAAEIRNNAAFRSEFAKMCTSIGVDPLAGSSANRQGSLWASLLGKDVNDFYFELAV